MPFHLRIIAYLNILTDEAGYFTVRLWNIPLFSASLKLQGTYIVLTNSKGKESRIHISGNTKEKDSIVNYLDNAFIRLVDINRLDVFFRAGKSDSAMFTALVTGGARITVNALFGILKSRYPNLKVSEGIEYAFDNDTLTLAANGIISLSLADIIYGIIYAYRRKIKNVKPSRT